ncbi:unnamed protein product [Pieris macdunnoughi]|uniref:Peptidase S1 domain-containing protein n=1 Tax=Pieris macdunnoughi TaxID=345717 RepID=A0A821L5L5_9NEOP|nr:unnamed protein product [Pieris macdunnoughi]
MGPSLIQSKAHSSLYKSLFAESGYPMLGDIPLLNRKIFRATRVTIREHPYIVSIRRKYVHYLTGCLLTKNLVLTVAHPLYRVPITELNVVVGENYSDRGTTLLTIVLLLIHKNFDPYTLKADICILRFYEDIVIRSSSKTIALMAPTGTLAGRAFVTGWGRCDFTDQDLCLPRSSIYFPDELVDPMLRSISFVISSPNNACDVYRQHDNHIRRGMLCVGDSRHMKPVAPCLGVPGAALIIRGKLVGLLSWGLGCGYAHDLPLIYTNIQHYFSWLVTNVEFLKNITRQHIKELFVVTKSYKLSVWLQRTREQVMVQPERRYNLQPLSIDTTLSKLEGRLYDIRDFINNGTYRSEKKEMYKEMKLQHNMTAIHFHNIPLKTDPFLSNESLHDEIEYDYDSDVEDQFD